MGDSAIQGVPALAGASGGVVSSVNTRTGAVVLTAADVGAGQLPAGVLLDSGIVIPSGADISGILGSSGSKAAAGNDARLSDTRVPTAHATSHKSGGSDAITIDQFAAAAADVNLGSHNLTNVLDPTSAQHAATKNYVDTKVPLATPVFSADPHLQYLTGTGTTAATVTTALIPTFYRINPQGHRTYPLSQLGSRVTTLSGATTFGLAVYSITWTDTTHWSASLVAQLNATASGAAATLVCGDVTTGAVGSGASVATLDFTTTYYVVGHMASTNSTLAFDGLTAIAGLAGYGLLLWNTTARSSVTDWPSSFDQTTTAAIGAQRITTSFLKTATGKLLP